MRPDQATALVQAMAVVFFAVATAAGAQVRIYLWEVPITLQTLFVYGSGLMLGGRNGLLSMLLYLALGMFLPVFAGDGYGPAYVFGAVSGGYLIGMPVAAAVTGFLAAGWRAPAGILASTVLGSLSLFACGVIWLHYAAGHLTWWQSIDAGWVRFLPFDAVKVLLVTTAYSGLRRFVPRS